MIPYVRDLARGLGWCGTQEMVAMLLELAPTAHFPGMALTFRNFQKVTDKCGAMVSKRMGRRSYGFDLLFFLKVAF